MVKENKLPKESQDTQDKSVSTTERTGSTPILPNGYRRITTHVVNPLNDRLNIFVIDRPGAGGVNHKYLCEFPHAKYDVVISFQNGPIAENGINGVTHEALLAIVLDRLECFQKGQYQCRENAIAYTKIEEALMWLQRRTLKRMARGVEGKSVI